MKLMSGVSRKYKDWEYKKHWIILPNRMVELLGWKSGDILKAKRQDDTLVIKKRFS